MTTGRVHQHSPETIIKYLDRYVVGQEQAKKDLALLGFQQQVRAMMEEHATYRDLHKKQKPLTGLITGPTGCGKTYLIKHLAKKINVPMLYVNAKDLTNTGYVGRSLASILKEQIRAAESKAAVNFTRAGDREAYFNKAVCRAIVFIDEFDKLVTGLTSDGWSTSLQNSLLAPLEGSGVLDNSRDGEVVIETSKMMFILGGSFTYLMEAHSKDQKSYGFKKEPGAALGKITSAELINAGVIRELVGRLNIVTSVTALNEEQLAAALDIEDGVLTQFDHLFKFLRQDEVSEDEKKQILRIALEANAKKNNNLGVRSLISAANEVLQPRIMSCVYEDLVLDIPADANNAPPGYGPTTPSNEAPTGW